MLNKMGSSRTFFSCILKWNS